MFIPFFYDLRENGINVTPTAFLRLQKALGLGLVTSWDDFYSVARAILIKSERDFDAYDKVFVNFITGVEKHSHAGPQHRSGTADRNLRRRASGAMSP